MDTKNYKIAYKRLIRRIIIALLLLLSIFFLKQFIIRYQIVQEKNTSYVINIAGRQRMLSQKIVKNIAFMNRDAESIVLEEKKDKQALYIDTSVNWIGFDIKNLIQKAQREDHRTEDVETTIEDKDGNLIVVIVSAVSGTYDGLEVVVLNLFDITVQKKAEEILRNAAIKDELTGLYNRYFLESILEKEIERSQRYEIPLSAALLDLDHFKNVNDKWGHPVGDSVLKFTADIVKHNIRKSDFPVRIGGEEFLILMPNTDFKGAFAAAEKIRQVLEKSAHPLIGNFTASFGVAQRNSGEQYADLYNRVDEALYKAKENGRNCVVLAQNTFSQQK